ncbi:molybdenum cofactor guanylyltransferase [Jiella mangrovi]|nr:molybdenum cofactor guanylyltransferase [Jiella mangrovi]
MRPAGLILAGGRGSRMRGTVPKPLIALAGRPLIAHVIERIGARTSSIILAAPRGAGYERFAHPLAPDLRPGLPGPLAGIEAGLAAIATPGPHGAETPRHCLVVPGDTPFLPRDLLERLSPHLGERPVVAAFAGRLQPATGLWPLSRLPDLSRWLDEGKPLAIRAFLESSGFAAVEIEPTATSPGSDPFFNVNTPDDLSVAETFLQLKSES